MRCPKCGYISFDHVDTCLKCNKDISKSSSHLEGTTYNVAPPSFLKFQKREHPPQGERSEISFDAAEDGFDVIDPDLDVLVEDKADEEEEGGISFGADFEGFGNSSEEEDFEVALGDEEEGGLDLGQFEDAFEEEEPSLSDEPFAMDIPDELSDISDLSAPEKAAKEQQRKSNIVSPAGGDDFENFDLDLELDDLGDDDFNLTAGDERGQQEEDGGLGDLSLDDLGLVESEEEQAPQPKKRKRGSDMDMDADLDFDLDLGGMSLDKDE